MNPVMAETCAQNKLFSPFVFHLCTPIYSSLISKVNCTSSEGWGEKNNPIGNLRAQKVAVERMPASLLFPGCVGGLPIPWSVCVCLLSGGLGLGGGNGSEPSPPVYMQYTVRGALFWKTRAAVSVPGLPDLSYSVNLVFLYVCVCLCACGSVHVCVCMLYA